MRTYLLRRTWRRRSRAHEGDRRRHPRRRCTPPRRCCTPRCRSRRGGMARRQCWRGGGKRRRSLELGRALRRRARVRPRRRTARRGGASWGGRPAGPPWRRRRKPWDGKISLSLSRPDARPPSPRWWSQTPWQRREWGWVLGAWGRGVFKCCASAPAALSWRRRGWAWAPGWRVGSEGSGGCFWSGGFCFAIRAVNETLTETWVQELV